MKQTLSIVDIIKINDKIYDLSRYHKVYKSARLQSFKNKPVEKQSQISIEDELVLYNNWIDLNYNRLNHYFYYHGGNNYDCSDSTLEYFKNKKCFDCSIEKKYIIYELLFQYSTKKEKYSIYKKLSPVLQKLIDKLLKIQIDDILEYDTLMKLIARCIYLQTKFKDINISMIEKHLDSTSQFSDLYNYYSFTIRFYNYCFKNINNIDIKRLLLNKLNSIEADINMYINTNHFSLVNNLYFKLGDVYQNASENTKAQYYYKQEIDLVINYCTNAERKDLSIAHFISKAIEISVNFTADGSYKLEELKKTYSSISTDIYKDLKHIENDSETLEHLDEYYRIIKDEYTSCSQKEDDVLNYLFLDFLHFSFIKKDIEDTIEKKRDQNFPIRHIASKVHVSHYGRISKKGSIDFFNPESTKKTLYDEHFHMFVPINNDVLFRLDYETEWISNTEHIILKYIREVCIIEPDFKKQAIKSIKAFFEKDYMIFCHLSLPIIEHILRNYLKKIDGDVYSVKDINTVQYKTLSELLIMIQDNKSNYMDNGILDYFKFILVEPDFLNFRNVILHGFMPERGFNRLNSMYILTILLYLIVYFKNDESII